MEILGYVIMAAAIIALISYWDDGGNHWGLT